MQAYLRFLPMGLKVFNFICDNGHSFEAMVASVDEFEKQKKAGLFRCPICDSPEVDRQLSAPHVKAESQDNRGLNSVEELETAMKVVKSILQQSEFVGDQFAQEARSIHSGKSPDRLIHGTPTPDEVVELIDEGIDVLPIPQLDTDKKKIN